MRTQGLNDMRRLVLVSSLIVLGGWSFAAHFPVQASAQTHVVMHPDVSQVDSKRPLTAHKILSKSARLSFIRRAQVWTPTDIPKMDLRNGPGGPGAFAPNDHVTCSYTDAPRHGNTRKFHCTLPGGNVV